MGCRRLVQQFIKTFQTNKFGRSSFYPFYNSKQASVQHLPKVERTHSGIPLDH